MPDSPTPPWSKLRVTLETRRQLETALFPVEKIGSKASPGRWQSHAAFVQHLKERREEHRRWNVNLFASLGLKSAEQARAKVRELKTLETQLWALCRPDLYPL